MRQIVAFIMAIVMLFSSVGIGNYVSFADDDNYIYDEDKYITLDDGSKKYYNKTLSEEQNFAVYGCTNDVIEHMNIKNVILDSSLSDKKESRYLGFNKQKEVILKMNIMTPVSISGELEDGYMVGDILITA